jgi:hypothetical protein
MGYQDDDAYDIEWQDEYTCFIQWIGNGISFTCPFTRNVFDQDLYDVLPVTKPEEWTMKYCTSMFDTLPMYWDKNERFIYRPYGGNRHCCEILYRQDKPDD